MQNKCDLCAKTNIDELYDVGLTFANSKKLNLNLCSICAFLALVMGSCIKLSDKDIGRCARKQFFAMVKLNN